MKLELGIKDNKIFCEFSSTSKNKIREFKGESLVDFVDSYTVIDLETTGLDPKNDKIIELAAIKIKNNEIINQFSTLINPKQKIDNFISDLTGITNKMLENAPTLEDKLEEFLDFIEDDIIVGHNVNFDINFLYDKCINILNQPFKNDYVDTLRISRKFVKDTTNYKLGTLANKFNIDYINAHRALKDCSITNELYKKLKEEKNKYNNERENYINNIRLNNNNIKNCVIKGITEQYTQSELLRICENNGIYARNYFEIGKSYDYIVLSYRKYDAYKFSNGDVYYDSRTKNVINEYDFYKLLGLPYEEATKRKSKTKYKNQIKAKDIVANDIEIDEDNPIFNKEVVFTGTLEKMVRKNAMQIVADLGGKNKDTVTKNTNYLILGNNDYCATIKDGKSSKQKKAEKYKLDGNDIEIISENVFYDMINDYIDN